MAEVAAGITGGNAIDRGSNRGFQRLLGARSHPTDVRLDLAERLLNRVEVRGVAGRESAATKVRFCP